MRLLLASVLALGVVVAGVRAQQPAQQSQSRACLHGPGQTPEQQARRNGAIQLARMINSMEATASGWTTFQPLASLGNVPVPTPDGFEVSLTTDGRTYAFKIKDSLDPCGYALFSDDKGVIYNATPLQ